MAPLALDLIERRGERRHAGGGQRWQPDAVLRPGQPVWLVNINTRAALVESAARLRPGACTEIQLASARNRARISVKGRLDRCHVAALEPLRYRGVLIFEQRLEIDEDAAGPLE